jgi:hypothetical protein
MLPSPMNPTAPAIVSSLARNGSLHLPNSQHADVPH